MKPGIKGIQFFLIPKLYSPVHITTWVSMIFRIFRVT